MFLLDGDSVAALSVIFGPTMLASSQELGRNAGSQAPSPQSLKQNFLFSKISGGFTYTIQLEKHCPSGEKFPKGQKSFTPNK